jgi:4-hydroxy-tetrahydrodipicolinate reductase
MRIALVGYGKMGRMIETVARTQHCEIGAIIDPVAPDQEITSRSVNAESLVGCDVVIVFTHPSVVCDHIVLYAKLGIPAVIGTTGWYDQIDQVRQAIEGTDCAIIYSGNYSLGVALFMQVVKEAARLFAKSGLYDPFLTEMHHSQKADSPSGTATMLAQRVLEAFPTKTHIEAETQHQKREESALHLASVRGGWVPGTHTVYFDSPQDTIELTHRARSREGFAVGAVRSAFWIADGRKGFFTLDDMLEDVYLSVERSE